MWEPEASQIVAICVGCIDLAARREDRWVGREPLGCVEAAQGQGPKFLVAARFYGNAVGWQVRGERALEA